MRPKLWRASGREVTAHRPEVLDFGGLYPRSLKPLIISKCLFVNLPERHKGRWGEGLTAADMDKCVWVRPEIVARIEFLEWTPSDHLRHSKFAGLREDKDPRKVIKEHAAKGNPARDRPMRVPRPKLPRTAFTSRHPRRTSLGRNLYANPRSMPVRLQ